MNTIKATAIIVGALFVSACASQIPPEIQQSLDSSPAVAQVQDDAQAHIAQKVRWGGVVLQTENKNETSRLTIVAYSLDSRGKPLDSSQSLGRFIAISDQFLEPEVYRADRKITIVGNLIETKTLKVDEYDYVYPLIHIDQVYLWPLVSDQQYDDRSPFWYDPWRAPYWRRDDRHHDHRRLYTDFPRSVFDSHDHNSR